MSNQRRWLRIAAVAAVVALAAVPVIAQGGGGGGGRPGGGGGGRRGGGMMGGIIGQVVSITETQLVIKTQRPQVVPGGGGGGGNRAVDPRWLQGGGGGETINLTITLNKETGYTELSTGADDDIDDGIAAVAIGSSGDAKFSAKGLITYKKPPQGDDRRAQFAVFRPLMMALRPIMPQLGYTRDDRPDTAMGVVDSVVPLVLNTYDFRAQAEKKVTVELANGVKYFKIGDIERKNIAKDRWVAVGPQFQGRPGGGGPGGGGGGGNRQAGDGGGGGPREITAGVVLQFPASANPARNR